MKVVTLLENTTCGDLRCEHGLSLYIETKKHKILFDSGASDAFFENAKALGVDLAAVDIAFLSHAHNDHCGGLAHFCELNKTAKVYMQKEAFGEYYVVTPARQAFIGLSDEVKSHKERFVFCDGFVTIDEELSVFSGVEAKELTSEANATLREKLGKDFPRDRFVHEQNLLITENGKTALFAGCAHTGVINIIAHAKRYVPRLEAVFAGFHLYNPTLKETQPRELVDAVAHRLLEQDGTRYYTGHCTGEQAFAWMKETLGERLSYMSGGTEFRV